MQPRRTLQPEDEISHYRVVGPLGAGGMGEVYLAQDQTLERSVALKVLPADLVRNEDRVRRFMLEAKSASSLSHPNIVTIYEIGHDQIRTSGAGTSDSAPVHFISMELISGKTLSTLIHSDKTDLRTLLGYLAQAAEGLAKAHAAGIVHRDLKPGNIMVSSDGFAKVLDFGLAKLTERRDADADLTSAPTVAHEATSAGAVLGTAAYMSPEQVQGKPVDHRSDIFSFGCMLYEATTRQRPFQAESGVEVMHKILHDKPAPVEDLNPKAPAELRRLIRRCLAKPADQRLQSMKDLAIELREIVDEFEGMSASASSGGVSGGGNTAASAAQAPPAAKRPVAALMAAGVAILASLVAIFVSTSSRRNRGDQGSHAYQTMRMTTLTDRGDVERAAISADGRYIVYVAEEPGEDGGASLRVKQIATGSDVEILPLTRPAVGGPSFTPDGNYIYFLMRNPETPNYRSLYRIPSLGGTPEARVFDSDSRAAFSPDGKSICFRRGMPQKGLDVLVVRDLESGKERELASVRAPQYIDDAPTWSPDGKRVAALIADPKFTTTIATFRIEDGRQEDVRTYSQAGMREIDWLPDGKGFALTGLDVASSITAQVWLAAYPGGDLTRVTNDFSDYAGVSVASNGDALAATRTTRLSNIWIAPLSGGPARQFTRTTSAENSPDDFGAPDSATVLFIAPQDQYQRVWSIPVTGGTPRPVTPNGNYDIGLYASAGRAALYRFEADGTQGIWGMNADGSNAVRLASGSGLQLLDLSRDGRIATYQAFDSNMTVWAASLDGGAPVRLGSAPTLGDGLISPDGKAVLLAGLKEAEGGLIRTFFTIVPTSGGDPIASFRLPTSAFNQHWSGDGASILFIDRASRSVNLYRQPIAGGAPQQVTHFTDGRMLDYDLSRDGSRVAVQRRIGDADNIWIVTADGRDARQVTQFSSGEIFDLGWMPDGSGVLFSQGTVSHDAVLIRNFR